MTDQAKNRAAGVTANQALNALAELEASAGFAWFMARIGEMRDLLATNVLHDDTLTPVEREERRQRFKQLEDVQRLPTDEARGAQAVLRSLGAARNDL
jgi:hypothetical protein